MTLGERSAFTALTLVKTKNVVTSVYLRRANPVEEVANAFGHSIWPSVSGSLSKSQVV